MNIRLQYLYNKLESQRQALLDALTSLPEEQLTKQPHANKWSVCQVLAHLETSERLSIQYLNKKIQGIEQYENTTFLHELQLLALKISQRLPFKFRAPKVVVANTPVYSSMHELIAEWNKTRAELKVLLEKFKDHQIKKSVYRHPRAGMMNIQQAIIFFGEHIIHHQIQIRRILKVKGV